jgi:hypothetical protein
MYKAAFILSIILATVLVFGCSKGPGKYDTLANCLTEKGVIMYGASWCTHCANQKALFGKSFQYVNYVQCSTDPTDPHQLQQCTDAGVKGYPTWSINGTLYAGEQNLYTLAKNAGCLDALNATS